ncbi:uncharacterized protein BO80DRAFT_289330 [Aspergillus ibericus CBS 121593]|uniref:Uncharacterized protein n=1 Tax=Aspergillus ibericus CBS 121593 TaxID=1448316 RepID=A0A395H9R3_9EURO|nr:hypothetical protein BO80DRAFT_289330 [Aspergillus ibericus CBS 121593]RAL03638.1 hypothetical protein BO80DRAFT_289330 [Aspergillus ibericus CBS 121593]
MPLVGGALAAGSQRCDVEGWPVDVGRSRIPTPSGLDVDWNAKLHGVPGCGSDIMTAIDCSNDPQRWNVLPMFRKHEFSARLLSSPDAFQPNRLPRAIISEWTQDGVSAKSK